MDILRLFSLILKTILIRFVMILCFLMNFQISWGKQYYSNVILHNTILLLKEYCPLIIILVLLLLILVVIDFQIQKYIHDGIMPPINLYELGFDKVYIKIINSSNYISIRLVFCPTVRYCNGWTNRFSWLGCKEFVLHCTLLQIGLYGSLEIFCSVHVWCC